MFQGKPLRQHRCFCIHSHKHIIDHPGSAVRRRGGPATGQGIVEIGIFQCQCGTLAVRFYRPGSDIVIDQEIDQGSPGIVQAQQLSPAAEAETHIPQIIVHPGKAGAEQAGITAKHDVTLCGEQGICRKGIGVDIFFISEIPASQIQFRPAVVVEFHPVFRIERRGGIVVDLVDHHRPLESAVRFEEGRDIETGLIQQERDRILHRGRDAVPAGKAVSRVGNGGEGLGHIIIIVAAPGKIAQQKRIQLHFPSGCRAG